MGSGSESALELNRFRIHAGNEIEMRYKVKAYGIPIELLPLTGTNTIKLNYHNQWIKARKLIEANLNRYHENAVLRGGPYKAEYEVEVEVKVEGSDGRETERVTIVECPRVNDVGFRNGTQSMENPGNAMFRSAIVTYWAEKEDARKRLDENRSPSVADDAFDREFRERLVADIEIRKKGRFLEWDKTLGIWITMKDRTRIHRKVAMAFYNYTKRRYRQHQGGGGSGGSRRRLRNDDGGGGESRSSPPLGQNYGFIDRGRIGGSSFCYGGADDDAAAAMDTSGGGGEGTNKRSCLAWPL